MSLKALWGQSRIFDCRLLWLPTLPKYAQQEKKIKNGSIMMNPVRLFKPLNLACFDCFLLMNWKLPLCFLFGLVLGAALILLIPRLQPAHSQLASVEKSLDQKDGELRKTQTLLSGLEEEQKVMQDEQDGLRKKIVSLEQKIKSTESTPEKENKITKIATGFLKQQSEAKIIALKSRLNLTVQQEADLRQHVEEESKFQEEITTAMMSGKPLSQEELTQRASKTKPLEVKLKEILSPEQMKAYEQFQADEKTQRRETSAQHSMSQISSMFPLNEEQKDKVYGILYSQDDFKPSASQPSTTTIQTDPKALIKDNQQQRLEYLKNKLKEVLTPEQLVIWSKQEEAKLKAQEEIMQKFMPK